MADGSVQVKVGDIARILHAIKNEIVQFGIDEQGLDFLVALLRKFHQTIYEEHAVSGIEAYLEMDPAQVVGPRVKECYVALQKFVNDSGINEISSDRGTPLRFDLEDDF